MSSQPQEREFSKLRSTFWPIHSHEIAMFVPMALIIFFIILNYSLVRNLKDSLIVTDQTSGAEVLNFLKTWVVLPASIIFVLVYAKMSNLLSKRGLYFFTLAPFFVFFTLFVVYLFPNRETLHPSIEYINSLKQAYPYFRWLFPIYGLWTYSAFYAFAELWGSVAVTMLFWQFANDVTHTSRAKRFYPMFGLIANCGLFAAGAVTKLVHRYVEMHATPGVKDIHDMAISTNVLVGLVIFGIVCIASLYSYLQFVVINRAELEAKKTEVKKPKKPKAKLSMKESFVYLAKSEYLRCIAVVVLCYGMAINLAEVTWKGQVKAAYPSARSYSGFMADIQMYTAIATNVLILCTKNMIRRLGWLTSAIVTPIVLGATGILFFGFVVFQESLSHLLGALHIAPILLSVYVGAAQNIFGKGSKYALFDPTKEMTYIPLDDELKVKGKAAVDVVGGRLGKSLSGYVQQMLLMFSATATQLTIAPYLGIMLLIISWWWIQKTRRLGELYAAAESQRAAEEAAGS